ncbi:hypothetical protein R1sor_016492 [Riccia sorocarpa]|uniref:Uncharacterized protein n=1 Tax=Riccia sorocarpa TaxID=122646 RepID=A0ABD3HF41_9MARC
MKQLRKSTREFLWGVNPNGTKKKPLLAWDWFERKKQLGGLGWPPLTEMANAFLLKNVSKILQGTKEDWVKLAIVIIETSLQRSNRVVEVRRWTAEEAMLGLDSLKITASKTLNQMLKTWFLTKKNLNWSPRIGAHPNAGSIKLLLKAAETSKVFNADEIRRIQAALRNARIKDLTSCDSRQHIYASVDDLTYPMDEGCGLDLGTPNDNWGLLLEITDGNVTFLHSVREKLVSSLIKNSSPTRLLPQVRPAADPLSEEGRLSKRIKSFGTEDKSGDSHSGLDL